MRVFTPGYSQRLNPADPDWQPCAGSGEPAQGEPNHMGNHICHVCGRLAGITKLGKLRQHRKGKE